MIEDHAKIIDKARKTLQIFDTYGSMQKKCFNDFWKTPTPLLAYKSMLKRSKDDMDAKKELGNKVLLL